MPLRLPALLLLLSLSFSAAAQTVTGYWYGTAGVPGAASQSNYLVELILNGPAGDQVQGIMNYYYRNTFRSMKVNGRYDSRTRELTLYNFPVPFYASSSALEVDCMMDLSATLRVAKAGSSLSGTLSGREAYKYTCPQLTLNMNGSRDAKNTDSVLTALRNFKETYQVWSPSATDTLVAVNVITRPVVNYVVSGEFKKRENEVVQEITVEGDSVSVDFYDNGEVDGDSISIFYNGKLVAFNRILSTRSIHFDMPLDTTLAVNEVTMFADNLGSIPPNTALMIVYDGVKRHEIRLSSNLQKNATVRIRRRKAS